MSGVAAIILAAGASTRLGQPKQLVRYQGRTLLARTIAAAQEAGCAPIIAVLGANAEACRAEAAVAEIVINSEWATGMASSIRAGLQATPEAGAALLLVCDQPHLSAAHLAALMAEWQRTGAEVVCSAYGDTHGVPALFAQSQFVRIKALTGDQGARKLLVGHHAAALSWPLGAVDIDTTRDLEKL